MASILVSVADAVVTAINGGTYTRTFTAERGYDVTTDLQDLRDAVRVDVVAVGKTSRLDSRVAFEHRPQVDVGVRYKFGVTEQDGGQRIRDAEIDDLVELLEQIHERLASKGQRGLATTPPSVYATAELKAWIPEHLTTLRQYTGILRVTYRMEQEFDA